MIGKLNFKSLKINKEGCDIKPHVIIRTYFDRVKNFELSNYKRKKDNNYSIGYMPTSFESQICVMSISVFKSKYTFMYVYGELYQEDPEPDHSGLYFGYIK
jgi:hypothetical protein